MWRLIKVTKTLSSIRNWRTIDLSRDGSLKSTCTQTRVVGMIINKMHPFFHRNSVTWGCILFVIFPTTLVCVLFEATIPTLIFSCFHDTCSLFMLLMYVAPLPPPNDVTVSININPLRLTFSWSPVSFNCPSLHYIISFNCGICPGITKNTTIVCADIQVNAVEDCNFAIQTSICDSIIGNSSSIPLILKGKFKLWHSTVLIYDTCNYFKSSKCSKCNCHSFIFLFNKSVALFNSFPAQEFNGEIRS